MCSQFVAVAQNNAHCSKLAFICTILIAFELSNLQSAWISTSTTLHGQSLSLLSLGVSFPWKIMAGLIRVPPLWTKQNILLLQIKVVSLASDLRPGRPGLCRHVLPWQAGQAMSPDIGVLFVAFYESKGDGGSILSRFHTERDDTNWTRDS